MTSCDKGTARSMRHGRRLIVGCIGAVAFQKSRCKDRCAHAPGTAGSDPRRPRRRKVPAAAHWDNESRLAAAARGRRRNCRPCSCAADSARHRAPHRAAADPGAASKLRVRIGYTDAHATTCARAMALRVPALDRWAGCACYPAIRRSAPTASNPARRDIPAAPARPCRANRRAHSSALRADVRDRAL